MEILRFENDKAKQFLLSQGISIGSLIKIVGKSVSTMSTDISDGKCRISLEFKLARAIIVAPKKLFTSGCRGCEDCGHKCV